MFRALSEGFPSLTAAVHLPCPILRHPRSGVSPFRFLSTAQQSSPAEILGGSLSRGSSPTMDHAHFTIDTFLVQPGFTRLASCAVLKQRQVLNHTGRAKTKSLLSFLIDAPTRPPAFTPEGPRSTTITTKLRLMMDGLKVASSKEGTIMSDPRNSRRPSPGPTRHPIPPSASARPAASRHATTRPQRRAHAGDNIRRQQAPKHRRQRTPQDKRRLIARIGAAIFATLIVLALWPHDSSVKPPEGLESNEVVAEQSPTIPPAAAQEMFIPAINVHANFEEGSCRVKDGAIDPGTLDKACTYTAPDRPYSLPGTNAPDIVVIAGHTGAGVPAVFNDLYDGTADRHRVAVGDKLYIRTAESGDNWLVYSASDLHDPSKDALSKDPQIWGDGPMPGRLLTISCIQPANPLASAVRNAVVGWQYQGTSNTASAPQPGQ